MANTFTSINVHIIFHVKSTGIKILNNDLGRTFSYIGGIINGIGGIPIEIGGIDNHIHILTSLPKNKSLSDFVRIIKSDSSRWIKTIDKYYNKFSWQEGYGALIMINISFSQGFRATRSTTCLYSAVPIGTYSSKSYIGSTSICIFTDLKSLLCLKSSMVLLINSLTFVELRSL